MFHRNIRSVEPNMNLADRSVGTFGAGFHHQTFQRNEGDHFIRRLLPINCYNGTKTNFAFQTSTSNPCKTAHYVIFMLTSLPSRCKSVPLQPQIFTWK